MIRYEDCCVGCATESYPCLGDACSYRHVPILSCDWCGDEVEELFDYGGAEICEDCLKAEFPKIEIP